MGAATPAAVRSWAVVTIWCALHQEPRQADNVRGVFVERAHPSSFGRHLDAQVVHRMFVVGEDDVHQVLADVVDVSPFLVASRTLPRLPPAASPGARSMLPLRVGHGGLHGSADWKLTSATMGWFWLKRRPTRPLPVEGAVDDVQGRHA